MTTLNDFITLRDSVPAEVQQELYLHFLFDHSTPMQKGFMAYILSVVKITQQLLSNIIHLMIQVLTC